MRSLEIVFILPSACYLLSFVRSEEEAAIQASISEESIKALNVRVLPRTPWFDVEFGDFERFETLPELLEELYYMLWYFTKVRIKNRLKMSPAQFRKQWTAKREKTITENSQLSTGYQSPPLKPPSRSFGADPPTATI